MAKQRLVRRLSWPPALMLSDCPGRITKSNGAAIISVEVAEGIGGEEQNRCWKGQEHYPIAERESPNGLDRDERLVCTGACSCACKRLMEMDAPRLDKRCRENHSGESRPTPAQQLGMAYKEEEALQKKHTQL